MSYEEILLQVLTYLKNTTELLATTAYQLAYKKALYYGFLDLFVGIVCFILFFFLAEKIKKHDYTHNILEYYSLKILGFIFLVIEICHASNWFINTELSALSLLIEMGKTVIR